MKGSPGISRHISGATVTMSQGLHCSFAAALSLSLFLFLSLFLCFSLSLFLSFFVSLSLFLSFFLSFFLSLFLSFSLTFMQNGDVGSYHSSMPRLALSFLCVSLNPVM